MGLDSCCASCAAASDQHEGRAQRDTLLEGEPSQHSLAAKRVSPFRNMKQSPFFDLHDF